MTSVTSERIVESYRLSPQQRRLWNRWRAGTPVLATCAVRLRGPLDPDLLAAALQETVERHEALRTTFRRSRGVKVPQQAVADSLPAGWRVLDLRTASPAERERALAGASGSPGFPDL